MKLEFSHQYLKVNLDQYNIGLLYVIEPQDFKEAIPGNFQDHL